MKIKNFLCSMIFDTRYSIILEAKDSKIGVKAIHEYRIEHLGEMLEKTEGLFATIASITNFLIQFIDTNEILGYCLIIFRRLYNFFPHYRKHLEEPLILIFLTVLKQYKRILDQSLRPN